MDKGKVVVRLGAWSLVLLAVVMLAASCAAPKVGPAGFLSDYSRLRPDPQQEGLAWWEVRNAGWQRYRRLMIDPVQLRLVQGPGQPVVAEDEAQRLAGSLHRAIANAVADRHPVVDAPGADVLRVRAALTRLKPVRPVANVVSAALLMIPVDVGEAALEAQFLDSRSGRVLGELTIASRGGHLDLGRVWTRWDQVEAAFADWGRRFRQALDEPAPGRD